jgi:hypothetical protein
VKDRKARASTWWVVVYIVLLAMVLLIVAGPSRAMPEYATNLGEPCATCHISPAGGGLRTARGQAWVAEEKPGAVPLLEEAMLILGVRTTINPADYVAAPLPRPTPGPLRQIEPPGRNRHEWLSDYKGN